MSKAWDERWRRYEGALQAAGVPGKSRDEARDWIENFIKTLRPRKWRTAARADVEDFLASLARKGITPWKCEAASQALRVFFQETEPTAWAVNWLAPFPKWIEPVSLPTLPQDAGSPAASLQVHWERMRTALGQSSLSPSTRLAYLAWVRRFLCFCRGAVTSSQAAEYLEYLARERALSSATLVQAYNALKRFHREVLQTTFPAERPTSAPGAPETTIPTDSDLVRVIEALPPGPNRILGELLWETGMALSEAVTLRIRHLDIARDRIVLEQKSEVPRFLPFSSTFRSRLLDHIEEVRKIWLADQSMGVRADTREEAWSDCWVFLSPRLTAQGDSLFRRHIHAQSFQQLLARVARRIGLAGGLTPHGFRRAFAARCLREGLSLEELQTRLGHGDLSSTMRYR